MLLFAINRDVDFLCPPYVTRIIRDNIGYDFGAWSDALINHHLYDKYESFIFVNSSVQGPFLKDGFNGKWVDPYIDGLQTNDLFGSTINTCMSPHVSAHVQSYIYSLNSRNGEILDKTEDF